MRGPSEAFKQEQNIRTLVFNVFHTILKSQGATCMQEQQLSVFGECRIPDMTLAS
jgi:hypothetical protein